MRTPSKRSVRSSTARSPPRRTCARMSRTAATGPSSSSTGLGSSAASARDVTGRGPPVVAARRSRRVSIGAREATDGAWRRPKGFLADRRCETGRHGPPRRRGRHHPHPGRRAPGPRPRARPGLRRLGHGKTWAGRCSRPSGPCAAPAASWPGPRGCSPERVAKTAATAPRGAVALPRRQAADPGIALKPGGGNLVGGEMVPHTTKRASPLTTFCVSHDFSGPPSGRRGFRAVGTRDDGQMSASTHTSQRGERASHTRRPWRIIRRLNRPRSPAGR